MMERPSPLTDSSLGGRVSIKISAEEIENKMDTKTRTFECYENFSQNSEIVFARDEINHAISAMKSNVELVQKKYTGIFNLNENTIL